jgi:hypothetical protein
MLLDGERVHLDFKGQFVGEHWIASITFGGEPVHLTDAVEVGRRSGKLLPSLPAERGLLD